MLKEPAVREGTMNAGERKLAVDRGEERSCKGMINVLCDLLL